jgi:hypothetical protein
VALSALSLSTPVPLTYTVFPAPIWAALRFGQRRRDSSTSPSPR